MKLSPREYQVAQLLAQGKRNKEIATNLGITDDTVRNHITSIMDKLGCRSRVLIALRYVDESMPEGMVR